MQILLTGFDPFGGEAINPAYEAVKQTFAPEGICLSKLEVPTKFGESTAVVADAIDTLHPDGVILVGQAGGRSAITPERVAINMMDATIADNAGFMPQDRPIVPNGKAAYFSTLPVKKMVAAMQAAGIPAQLSNTAGTFVCNQLLYGVLRHCEATCPKTRACFIHVPFLPSQTARRPQYPSMELSTMVKGLEICLRTLIE